jgi:hypothetical protein
VDAADQALYAAKHAGRNQVASATLPSESQLSLLTPQT